MALISFAVTAKLICTFVLAYAKSRFSHDAAHFASLKADDLIYSDMEIKTQESITREPAEKKTTGKVSENVTDTHKTAKDSNTNLHIKQSKN